MNPKIVQTAWVVFDDDQSFSWISSIVEITPQMMLPVFMHAKFAQQIISMFVGRVGRIIPIETYVLCRGSKDHEAIKHAIQN